jgi:hypothetical protein
VPSVDRQERTLEVAERAQEDLQQKWVETALRLHLRRQAMRIQSCSLLAVIEVVTARLVRLLRSLREMCSLPLGTADAIEVVRRGSRREG